MDMNDVETIRFNALGGIDRIAVHDLSGTDIVQVDIDLAGTLGGSIGDGEVDTVAVDGTNGNDAAALSIQNGELVLDGLENEVVIENFEAADIVQFAGLAGADTLEFDGGNGAEQITITPNGAMVTDKRRRTGAIQRRCEWRRGHPHRRQRRRRHDHRCHWPCHPH